mgnify:CR=1 FL=1
MWTALHFLWRNMVPVICVFVTLFLAYKVFSQQSSMKEMKSDVGNLVQMISRIPRQAPRKQMIARPKRQQQKPQQKHNTVGNRAYHNPSAPIQSNRPSSGLPPRHPPIPGKDPNTDDETNAALTQWFQSGGVTRAR